MRRLAVWQRWGALGLVPAQSFSAGVRACEVLLKDDAHEKEQLILDLSDEVRRLKKALKERTK